MALRAEGLQRVDRQDHVQAVIHRARPGCRQVREVRLHATVEGHHHGTGVAVPWRRDQHLLPRTGVNTMYLRAGFEALAICGTLLATAGLASADASDDHPIANR